MFLFFSKLLPLFVYPLGLASILLLVGLIIAWKRPYFALFPMGIALGVLLIFSNAWVSSGLTQSLEWQHISNENEKLPEAEAIILLGGSTQAPIPPRNTVEITGAGDRVLYAAHLYKQGKAPLIIATGGRISWLGNDTPEATNMKQLLVEIGVPASAVIEEPQALNTHDNAVYTQEILEEKGIKQCLLVTSASHMPRSVLTFKKQEIDIIPAPTDFSITRQHWQQLQSTPQATLLNSLPDADHLEQSTRVLKEYLGIFVYWLRGWI
ncbi:YdcF family protein [Euhalothece natronophila Z-M001]|uniref:YdcF family protein n=1 Tax=Euhalothece natronophila Z-M001 TaxID=522448 RepID=A0A5B8NKD1_9CHRO|nr:YdcF family protein [Euhalothece natronophila]QDZ39702.1 YdcF family protein [Euhalothece natronophila Z-M001]